jgi:hypothetical protein
MTRGKRLVFLVGHRNALAIAIKGQPIAAAVEAEGFMPILAATRGYGRATRSVLLKR